MKKLLLAALLFSLLLVGCQEQPEPVPAESPAEPVQAVTETEETQPKPAQAEDPPAREPEAAEPSQRETGAESPVSRPEGTELAESMQLTIYTEAGLHSEEAVYYEAVLREGDAPVSFSLYYNEERMEPVFVNNAYRFLPFPDPPEETEAEEEAEGSAELLAEEEEAEAPEEEEEAPPVPPMERTTYLEVSLINGTTVNALSPTLIDGYLDFTDIEFTSYVRVGAQRMEAGRVSAGNEDQYVEAYLINVQGGVVVAVLSGTDSSDEDLLWFRAMLSTLRLA